MIPHQPTAELSEIVISVSKASFRIDQVVTFNAYGDETRIVLSNYQFDIDPPDSLFTFTIPEGVDVVQIDQP